jgi:excisionase family DNA binding protein
MPDTTVAATRASAESVVPVLLKPQEVASVLQCSEWWVKEQARRRRIPFTRAGGAYRFTAEHLREIIRIFEEWPKQPPGSEVSAAHRRQSRSRSAESAVQLRGRRPRRARSAG